MNRLKVVAVGDGAVGKTSLLMTYSTGDFPEEYNPTVFDNFTCNALYQNRNYQIDLWDTAGQEEYDRLRPLSYPGTNVFLLCFSLIDQNSFDNVSTKWAPELTKNCPEAPIILVGTKMDQRDESWCLEFVGTIQAQEVAEQIGAKAYCEVSSKTNRGLKELFEKVIAVAEQVSPEPLQQPEKQDDGKYHIYDGSIYKRILNLSMFTDESILKDKIIERESEPPVDVAKDYLETVNSTKYDQNSRELAALLFSSFETDRKICIPPNYISKVRGVLKDLVGIHESEIEKIMDNNVDEFPRSRHYDSDDRVFVFFQPVDGDEFTGDCNIIGIDNVQKHGQYRLFPLTGEIKFKDQYGLKLSGVKMKKHLNHVKLIADGKVYKLNC